jgi:phosphoserine aminotransferase
MKRVMNFNPGPAAMPLEVLQEAKDELLDFAGTGMSILEVSHRSKDYEKVHNETQELLKELLGLGAGYKVLFMGGGAYTQFEVLPMNFLNAGQTADYIVTGSWAQKAFKEGKIVASSRGATARAAATTEVDKKFTRIPKPAECSFTDNAAYVHLTSNNTIFGTQWHTFPEVKVPLTADMSSDILWRPFDASKFSLIYAGAQKNLGPAGVAVIIIKEDFLAKAKEDLPTIFSYKTHAKENSLFNTPPVFAIYLVGKTLKWIKKNGGLANREKVNRAKGDLLYATIDKHADFFKAPVEKESRSYMNVVFRLPSEELETKFVDEAKKLDMIGLKGHRSVGGIRATLYNAVTLDTVKVLTSHMEDFIKKNG